MVMKPISFGNVGYIIGRLGSYGNPHGAFKEYISNSIDARLPDRPVNIDVKINRRDGLLVVNDDGGGMSYDFLSTVPERVGESIKKGIRDNIGRMAIGIFAYHTFGEPSGIELYTRELGSKGPFGYLTHEHHRSDVDIRQVKPDKVPGGEFEHGTRVILKNIPFTMFDNFLTPGALKKAMREIFDPLLRKGVMNLNVGYSSERGSKVLPIDYKGHPALGKVIDVKYRNPKKPEESGEGSIEMYIFVNPDGTVDKVGVYDRGVKVLRSVTNLPELDSRPWNSGKLQGYVNENFLELTSQRNQFEREYKFFIFVEKLKGYEDFLGEEIKKFKEAKVDQKKLEMQDWGKQFVRALDEIYKEIRKYFDMQIPTLVKGKKGDQEITGIETQEKTTSRFGGKKSPSKPVGRRIVKPQEGGSRIPVRPGRPTLPRYNVSLVNFDLDEKHLRSKLEPAFSSILINEDHEDYKSRREDEKESRKYMGYLISKEASQDIFGKLISEGFDTHDASRMASDLEAEFYIRGIKVIGLD